MTLKDLQLWLNARGARLTVDGKSGPKTRAAILDLFVNRTAPAITEAEIATIAKRLGGTVKQVAAVAAVESAGGGWDNAGRLKCLWERHYLWRRIKLAVPGLSNPTPGGYTVDADADGINDSWERLADAAMRWPGLAFECASFGKFQIMGAWGADLGYGSALEFVWALTRSERAHYEALARYIEVNGLGGAFRALSTDPETCRAFAKGYNGSGYAAGGYHTKLARAMR